MQVGSLVKHIEFGYIGIITKQSHLRSDHWLIHWNTGQVACWYTSCELGVICK